MKKIAAILLSIVLLLSLASCKITENSASGKKDGDSKENTTVSAQKGEESNENGGKGSNGETNNKTTVDYSKVLKKLNRKEKALIEKFGKSEEGKKYVAFFGDDFETQFIVAEFTKGKVSSVKNYRFFKDDSKYDAYVILAEKLPHDFTVHEDEKCIEQKQTKQYRGKTYDEMVELLHGYDHM